MRQGGVVLYPTDTVWGIGCDATNSVAVRKVFDIKRRADSKSLILLVADGKMLRCHAAPLPEAAEALIDSPDTRPTTLVVDGGCGLAPEVVAQDGSVGMRITREVFSRELCRRYGAPIVSTSANISGEPTAAIFAEISPEIIDGVDYVCTSRRDDDTKSAPSKIVKIDRDGHITVLRP